MRRILTIAALVLLALAAAYQVADARSNKTARANRTTKNARTNHHPFKMNKNTPADVLVEITTSLGNITIRLYGDTPRHRDNFVKLVNDHTYDGTLFHRVINEFMIQAGDPDSKNAPAGKMLGSGDLGYELDAEILYPKHFHKRGAIAAARTSDSVNPMKRSSGCQFYIVTGRKFNDAQLTQMERQLQHRQMQAIFDRLARENRDTIMALRRNRDQAGLSALQDSLAWQTEAEAAKSPVKFTAEQRQAYTTVGGAPHLDGDYTVYGEVVSGMEVVDKIEKVETDSNDRPKQDVKILSMKIVK